jgi:hypothetical protein
MDPNACYTRVIELLDEGDIFGAKEAANDLREWIARGGFEPAWTSEERESFYKFVRSCGYCGRMDGCMCTEGL